MYIWDDTWLYHQSNIISPSFFGGYTCLSMPNTSSIGIISWLARNSDAFHISISNSSYISKQKSCLWFQADNILLPNGFLSFSAAFNQPNINEYHITCWKGKLNNNTMARLLSSWWSSSYEKLTFCPKILTCKKYTNINQIYKRKTNLEWNTASAESPYLI